MFVCVCEFVWLIVCTLEWTCICMCGLLNLVYAWFCTFVSFVDVFKMRSDFLFGFTNVFVHVSTREVNNNIAGC